MAKLRWRKAAEKAREYNRAGLITSMSTDFHGAKLDQIDLKEYKSQLNLPMETKPGMPLVDLCKAYIPKWFYVFVIYLLIMYIYFWFFMWSYWGNEGGGHFIMWEYSMWMCNIGFETRIQGNFTARTMITTRYSIYRNVTTFFVCQLNDSDYRMCQQQKIFYLKECYNLLCMSMKWLIL